MGQGARHDARALASGRATPWQRPAHPMSLRPLPRAYAFRDDNEKTRGESQSKRQKTQPASPATASKMTSAKGRHAGQPPAQQAKAQQHPQAPPDAASMAQQIAAAVKDAAQHFDEFSQHGGAAQDPDAGAHAEARAQHPVLQDVPGQPAMGTPCAAAEAATADAEAAATQTSQRGRVDVGSQTQAPQAPPQPHADDDQEAHKGPATHAGVRVPKSSRPRSLLEKVRRTKRRLHAKCNQGTGWPLHSTPCRRGFHDLAFVRGAVRALALLT